MPSVQEPLFARASRELADHRPKPVRHQAISPDRARITLSSLKEPYLHPRGMALDEVPRKTRLIVAPDSQA